MSKEGHTAETYLGRACKMYHVACSNFGLRDKDAMHVNVAGLLCEQCVELCLLHVFEFTSGIPADDIFERHDILELKQLVPVIYRGLFRDLSSKWKLIAGFAVDWAVPDVVLLERDVVVALDVVARMLKCITEEFGESGEKVKYTKPGVMPLHLD